MKSRYQSQFKRFQTVYREYVDKARKTHYTVDIHDTITDGVTAFTDLVYPKKDDSLSK